MNDFEAELQLRPKEVRGKYARPVMTVNGTLQLLDTVVGPMTRRPVTSGSLVPSRRSSVKTPDARKAVAFPVPETPKSHKRTRSLIYTSRRRSDLDESKPQENPPVPDLHEEVPAPPNPPEDVIAAEDAETNPEAVEAPVEADEDRSTTSWVTTKSQQMYIAELEQLLRQERKKRIAAELQLQTSGLAS